MLVEIKKCEVCGSSDLTSVLDMGMHPMCDDLVAINDKRVCKEYPIEILFCGVCNTAHQRFQIPKHELFPHNYHYRARHTEDVISGMRELVNACISNYGGVQGKKILDVGCNDGSLLSIFKEKGAETFGIEPTGAFEDAVQAGHVVDNKFFTEAVAQEFVNKHGKPDIITFTNVFAHIEDLTGIITALKLLLHSESTLIIENHYLGAVLERFQFDTFYHEHPRTYSYTSFAHIGNSLGMYIHTADFPERYNGNIRIFYKPKTLDEEHTGWDDIHPKEKSFGHDLEIMSKKLISWKKEKRAEIDGQFQKHGKLKAKAFPGRAAIPIKLLGLDERLIEAVYEKPLSGKIGHYIPGTRIPIVSDDAFNYSEEDLPLLNLAWHIGKEIRSYMQRRGYKGAIIDIISETNVS